MHTTSANAKTCAQLEIVRLTHGRQEADLL